MSWIDALRSGCTVIVPSERYARELRMQYSRRRASDSRVWAAPDIMSFRSWLIEQWTLCLPSEQLLYPAQELAVHRYALTAEGVGDRVMSLTSLSRELRQTDCLVDEYGIELAEPGIQDSDEYALLVRLRERVSARLQERGWMTAGRVVNTMVEWLESGVWRPATCLYFEGFVALTPQQAGFVEVLRSHGHEVTYNPMETPVAGEITRALYEHPSAEADAVARAISGLLGGCKTKDVPRVAVLVPSIIDWRDTLEEAFTRGLAAGMSRAGFDGAKPWAYSRGRTLADHADVAAAMDLLGLDTHDNDAARLGRVLLNRCLWSHGDAVDRAEIEYALREIGGARHGIGVLDRIMSSKGLTNGIAQNLSSLVAHVRASPRKALPSAWSAYFEDRLSIARWRLQSEPTSLTYQLHQAWRESQRRFIAMDAQLGRINQAQAWFWLSELLHNRDFVPRTGVDEPIQVLEYADAPGLSFDHAFVMGLDATALPGQVDYNPFLDADRLSQAGVPHATPDAVTAWGHSMTGWLSSIAPRIVFSSSAHDERGALLLPSPVAGPWPALTYAPDSENPGVADTCRLPDNDLVPPVSDDEAEGVWGGVSTIARQAEAPYVAFVRSRLGVQPLPGTGAPLSARVQGCLVHGVLEAIWSDLGDSDRLKQLDRTSRNSLIRACVYRVAEDWGLLPAGVYGPALAALERRRVAGLCERWLSVEARRRWDFEVVACECTARAVIRGLPVRLRLDRVDRIHLPGGTAILAIDYKTGAQVTTAGWRAERLLEPQLPIYATSDAMGSLGFGECDGIALAHIASHGCEFKLTGSFAARLVPNAAGETGDGMADWPGQMQAWRESIAGLAAAFMRGEAYVTPAMLRDTSNFADVASLMHQREDTA